VSVLPASEDFMMVLNLFQSFVIEFRLYDSKES
ncbi:hypothetical protein A2U01_0077338, partial [Trifolium medium]|nr:hypothetical protein [Trifolium medium]